MSELREYEGIVSKPINITYEYVQRLGIYCCPDDREMRKIPLNFLPRLSFNQNEEYLNKRYPGISAEKLKGKGIFVSVWRIKEIYKKVPIENPESHAELAKNPWALRAFKTWTSKFGLMLQDTAKQSETAQIFVLSDEASFDAYKYTKTKNPQDICYYGWDEILGDNPVIAARQ